MLHTWKTSWRSCFCRTACCSSAPAERHDAAVWRCLQGLLGIEGDGTTLDLAQLPLHWGGLGLRTAARSSCAAHWASWADSLPIIQKRHTAEARLIIAQLTDQSDGLHLSGATFSRERLLDVSSAVPTRVQIADGLHPGQPQGRGARCASPVAILRVPGCGRVFLHPWRGNAPHRHSAGVGEVSVRLACSHPLHLLPYFLADPFRRARVSGVASPPPLCPRPLAGVAVHSTPLATTGLEQFQGCWADDVCVGERGGSGPGLATSWGCGPETT